MVMCALAKSWESRFKSCRGRLLIVNRKNRPALPKIGRAQSAAFAFSAVRQKH